MLLRLLVIFTVIPLVELALLLEIANRTGVPATITLVLGTGFLGAWLARHEGVKALMRIQSELNAGAMPTGAMLDGALIVVAGIVLVTPGILTDLAGFALLTPPIRAVVKRKLLAAFRTRVVSMEEGGPAPFVDVVARSHEAEAPDGAASAPTNQVEPRQDSPNRD